MTLRESYIQGLMAALQAVPSFPALVERSVVVAFSRAESPVLVVHRGAEDLENTMGDDTYRTCEILVSVVARSDAPDQVADEVMEVAHPVIMAYMGARMLQMQELGTNAPVFAQADSKACLMTTRYGIQYVTDRLSLA